MTSHAVLGIAALLFAVGMWLMLPGGRLRGRLTGIAMAVAGCGLFGSQIASLAGWGNNGLFAILACVTVGASAAAISLRNPLYCAIWFGMSLVGTAGLFLFQGAEFLAVATIVVYAGAILVTFLFVLMLAQPRGRARYDRVSWDALVSAFCGAFITGVLTVTIAAAIRSPELRRPALLSAADRERNVLSPQHTARIGGELFGHYLIAVEVGGVLLLAALVGAAVIVGQSRGPLGVPLAACPPVPSPHGQQAARGTREIEGDGHV
jgi:NADH-quinone oxidoreductase subunit J